MQTPRLLLRIPLARPKHTRTRLRRAPPLTRHWRPRLQSHRIARHSRKVPVIQPAHRLLIRLQTQQLRSSALGTLSLHSGADF